MPSPPPEPPGRNPYSKEDDVLSTYDIDLARRDTALPGLATILDPQRFLGALQPFMPEAGLEDARTTYVRYKPGMNGLVAYELDVDGASLIAYAKAHRRKDREKIQKAHAHASVATAFGPGRIVLEDDAVVISLFPNDSKLRSLSRLGDETNRRRLLQRVFPNRSDLWGGTIQPLRYKPERRFVAQVCAGEAPAAALKCFTGSGYRTAKHNAQAFTPRGPLQLAARLGRSNRHRILAFAWMPGRLLSDVLVAGTFDDGAVEIVGAALAALHGQQADRLRPFTAHEEAEALRAVASGLSFICPQLAPRAQTLASRLATALGQEPSVSVPIHGDFYAKQVLIRDDTATILDLDRAAQGNPATDLGTFLAHLERDCLRGRLSEDGVERIKAAFLSGYQRATTRPASHRIELAIAAGLFQLAPHPFRFREPDWPDRTEAMLERVEALLNAASSSRHPVPDGYPAPHAARRPTPIVSVVDPFVVTVDPRMPFLKEALDPEAFEVQCRRFLPPLTEDQSRLALRTARVIRHKPGRRCLIEYAFDLERPGVEPERLTLIGKVRAKGLDQTTYHRTEMLWRGRFGLHSEDGISVPEPIGCLPPFRMWLQRKVPGTLATAVLAGPEGIPLARQIAHALHKLHRDGSRPRGLHTIDDELRILHDRIPHVARHYPSWTPRLKQILEACDRLGAAMPEPRPRPIHRDFYGDNILVDGDRLYLLDLDLYCAGDPALDAGNFIGHITEQSLRTTGDPTALAAREQAFEEAFVAAAGAAIRSRVRAYTTLTLVRHIYLSTLFDERRPFTERLITLCEARLFGEASATRTRSSITKTEAA